MDLVWLVESGDYSSYRVWCACGSEEEAQRVVDKLNAVDPRSNYTGYSYSERWLVTADDVVAANVARLEYPWAGREHDRDFTVEPKLTESVRGWMFRQDDPEHILEMSTRRDDQGRLRDPYLVETRSAEPERARKAAQDRLAFLRAQEEGLT